MNYAKILFLSGFLLQYPAMPGLYAEDKPEEMKHAVIAMARKHLGGDEKLKSVHSLKYVGSVNTADRDRLGEVVMYLKKPLKQRIEIRAEDGVMEVTAVNGYEGWILKKNPGDETADVRVMNADNLNRMLVSTWENLNFFVEPVQQHGKTIYCGKTEYRGRPVYELHVIYPGGEPTFRRYFDMQTGELIGSLTDDGMEFIESGMIMVEGLQFPRKIEAFRGGKRIHMIKFDEILVNPSIPDALFNYPEGINEKPSAPFRDDFLK